MVRHTTTQLAELPLKNWIARSNPNQTAIGQIQTSAAESTCQQSKYTRTVESRVITPHVLQARPASMVVLVGLWIVTAQGDSPGTERSRCTARLNVVTPAATSVFTPRPRLSTRK